MFHVHHNSHAFCAIFFSRQCSVAESNNNSSICVFFLRLYLQLHAACHQPCSMLVATFIHLLHGIMWLTVCDVVLLLPLLSCCSCCNCLKLRSRKIVVYLIFTFKFRMGVEKFLFYLFFFFEMKLQSVKGG